MAVIAGFNAYTTSISVCLKLPLTYPFISILTRTHYYALLLRGVIGALV